MEGTIASHEVLDARRFAIAVRKLADALSFGTDRSPFLGSGLEYAQSRPYQDGDPVKAIDWRVTARTGRPFVKEYEATKRLVAYLLVDTSASMTVGLGKPTKYETAVFLAGGLALACLDRISPVGVMGVGGRGLHERPSLAKDQVMEWLHRLRTYRLDEPTNLATRVAELTPGLAQRSMVVVLSDLHDPKALPSLKRLAQRHDCVVLQLRDPAEEGLRGVGFVRGREAETGRGFVARGLGAAVDQEAVEGELRRAGIDHLLIDVERPYAARVRQFFKGRHNVGKGAR